MSTSPLTRITTAGKQSILARLARSRRVFDRLDWWGVEHWAGSPALHVEDDAALLIVPPDLNPAQAVGETRMQSAWVRWCAISDGTSASPLLARMLDLAHKALRQAGVIETWVIVHPQDWLLVYLQDAGYEVVDRMLTYEAAPDRIEVMPAASPLLLRPLREHELHLVTDMDARAFEPAWRYPPAIMKPAFAACAVFTLAEWRGVPVGYCCALLNGDHGHVVRLAVEAPHRGAGIGAALLGDVVKALGRQGAVSVSLNTQGDNASSQHLYLRMGFGELLERPMVLRKYLAQQDDRAGS